MQTPERDRRKPHRKRRIAATATLAAATIVGAGPTPANAAEPTSASASPAISPLLAAAPTTTPADLRVAASVQTAASSVTTKGKLTPDHSSVTAGHTVTFAVTDRTSAGSAVPSALATFYVHTVSGWKKWSTAHLSANGNGSFSFKPNYDHAYKVAISAVTAHGVAYAGATTPSVTVAAKPADIGGQIVAAAAKEKGRPYKYGADGPNSFDCSGLVKYVFAKFGIDLPHQSDAQMSYGSAVSANDAVPGDLVFVVSGGHASHVAIYAGNDTWWEAPHPGADVRLVKIWSSSIRFRHVR